MVGAMAYVVSCQSLHYRGMGWMKVQFMWDFLVDRVALGQVFH